MTMTPTPLAPFSEESEAALLGAVLTDDQLFALVASLVRAEDFFILRHGYVWTACERISQRGARIDYVSVTAELRSIGTFDEVGGAGALLSLINACPNSTNAEVYARIVQRAALRRRMLKAGDQIKALAVDEVRSVDEALANAERYMAELRGMGLTEHPPLYQQGAEILEELEQLMSNPETVMGIPSQFSAINALTLGWHKDALTIIAAIPGAGKTSYMLGEALHAARLGQRVGIVSQEMDNKSLLLRLVSAETGINLQSLRSGKLASDEYRKVITAMGRITALPLYLYDRRVTPAQLRAKALHWGSRDGLDLLFVDYLQIMQPGIKSDNRAAQVADIARALKDLNRELHIPVVVAAQLNRELYSRPDKRPQLSDLKESSEIEQAADMVMFIHQPAMFEPPDGASQTIAQFIIAKQRNGPTGEIKLAFDRKTTRFVEALVRHIDMSAL